MSDSSGSTITDISVDQLNNAAITPAQNTKCFYTNDDQSRNISNNLTNIWGDPLFLGARYPFAEIAAGPPYKINYSEFSNKKYRDMQVVNPINGLVGILTNETKAASPQSVCDQSAVALLKILHEDANFKILDSALPEDFETASSTVQARDCQHSLEYGLRLLRSMDEYQKNCWAYCFESDVTGYRKGLGTPFDEALDIGDGTRNSNVVVRLLTCQRASWFAPNVSAVVYNVFNMCSSSAACAGLCSGMANETDAAIYQDYFKLIVDWVDNATATEREDIPTPSLVSYFMQPIGQVQSLFSLSIPENIARSAVAQYIDNLANPVTGRCPTYDGVMSALPKATGGSLSPFWQFAASDSLSTVRAVRSPAFAACQAAIQQLYDICTHKDTVDLCARAEDPAVVTLGSFSTCDDSGLLAYRGAVLRFNDRRVP